MALLGEIHREFGGGTDWGSAAFIYATRQAPPFDRTANMDGLIRRIELFERLRVAHAAHVAGQEASLMSELTSAIDFDPATGRPVLGQGFDASSTERDDTIGASSLGSQHLDVLEYGHLDPDARPKSLCDLEDAFVQNVGFGVELPTTGGDPQALFNMSSAGNRMRTSVREIPQNQTLWQPFNNGTNPPPDDKEGGAQLDVLGHVLFNLNVDPQTGNLTGRIGYEHVWRFGFPSIPVAPGVGLDAGVAASLTIAGDLQIHNGARIPAAMSNPFAREMIVEGSDLIRAHPELVEDVVRAYFEHRAMALDDDLHVRGAAFDALAHRPDVDAKTAEAVLESLRTKGLPTSGRKSAIGLLARVDSPKLRDGVRALLDRAMLRPKEREQLVRALRARERTTP